MAGRYSKRRIDGDNGWVGRRFREQQRGDVNALQAVPGSQVTVQQLLTDPNSVGAYEENDQTTASADDTTVTLVLSHIPIDESLLVFKNGIRLLSEEFSRASNVVTVPPSANVIIRTGDSISSHYCWDTTADTSTDETTLFDERMADSPVAYYRFNESSGSDIFDSSGNGNDGLGGYIAGYTFGAASLDDSDLTDASIDIDPATCDIAIPFSSWMNVTEITVVSLIKPDAVTAGRCIAARDNNGTVGPWNLRIDNSGVIQW